MKYIKSNKVILLFLLIAFAALSFAPCLTKTTSSSLGLIDPNDFSTTVSQENYLPLFCCIVTVPELLLLLCIRRGFLILGLFLNLIKTFAPLIFVNLRTLVIELIGQAHSTYTFSIVGYILAGLGIVISVLYIVFFVLDVRNEKAARAEHSEVI